MSTTPHSPLRRHRFAAPFSGVWAGLVIGGSLVAAPAKFQAPSLTREVALDVGRAQFAWLGVTELVLCAALLVAAFGSGPFRWALGATVVFGLQRLVLMPVLDERTLRIIAGEAVEPSMLHGIYVAFEVVKLALLLGCVLSGPVWSGQGQPTVGRNE